MRFSTRTDWDLAENELALAVRKARDAGAELLDLTVSNPTACGFSYDSEALLRPLAAQEALRYEPDPLGMASAREAVAQYYCDAGAAVATGRICLTTSTSEGYSFLFRLLCDPGDEVLIARPSYPLFDYIAQLDDVRLVEYPLVYEDGGESVGEGSGERGPESDLKRSAGGGWQIDLHALEREITPRTRAVVVVHPNNPTGNFVSEKERGALQDLCARRGVALIADEVFLDYALPGGAPRSFARGKPAALTFVLSGLSKICGLPQMKVSWIVAAGPEDAVRRALARLEVIADTFLSMNAPMQFALPRWLAERGGVQRQIGARTQANLAALDRRARGTLAGRLAIEGGWTAVLRVPRHVQGVEFVEAALARGVLVQPGAFYGLPEGRVVLSLLTPPEIWQRGLERLPID